MSDTNWAALTAEDKRRARREREQERLDEQRKAWGDKQEAEEAERRLEPEPDFPGDER